MTGRAEGVTARQGAGRMSSRRTMTGVLIGLGVYLVGALLLLLAPTSPQALVTATTAWLHSDIGLGEVRQGWVEFGANVVLFVPLGVLVTLAFRAAWIGVTVAAVLSASAELVQVLLPNRTPSARDVLANVLGAAIGAAIVVALRAGRRHRDTPSEPTSGARS
jgi:glycopeptide antibiotics resistance protein